MTFQNIWQEILSRKLKPNEVSKMISEPDKLRRIRYYLRPITETMPPEELQELEAIVNILQVVYNAGVSNPIRDSEYDTLQENLISMGVPRLSGSIEVNSLKKKEHRFTQLRGTLDKVYYLSPDESRVNPSRKYLHEWKRGKELILRQQGMEINLDDQMVLCQPKFDGVSVENESDMGFSLWLLRGDTSMNKASDVSHIMGRFDQLIKSDHLVGTKTEAVMTLENMNQVCMLMRQDYTSSRQLVAAILNSTQPDFRVDYLTPIPLRIVEEENQIERVHPFLIKNFPTKVCRLGDIDAIRAYAEEVRDLVVNGNHYPTDGVVITLTDPEIKKALGRINNVNQFEVAYKYGGEEKYSRVKGMEFDVSMFGYITPVLVVEDLIMKGRTVNHISLSNRERFDELGLSLGDEVKVHYEIIPYATVDKSCRRDPNHRLIPFITKCPMCGSELDLSKIEVKCENPDCKCRRVGRILNYCVGTRMKNIGYQILVQLYDVELVTDIVSLYKLKKFQKEISFLPGFGPMKSRKIIAEIESERRLPDWQFFGSIGIEGMSHTMFRTVFREINVSDFIEMITARQFDKLQSELIRVNGIGTAKADLVVKWFKIAENRDELKKLMKEVNILPSTNTSTSGLVVFTGCRPDDSLREYLESRGYEITDKWKNSARILIVPDSSYESAKVAKAKSKNIPIIPVDEISSKIN